MRIYQISDLHIDDRADIQRYKEKIELFCEFVRDTQPKNESFIITVLGDLISNGEALAFQNVEKIFDYIQTRLEGYLFHFEFLPGNHDICNNSLSDFDRFILKYQQEEWRYSKNNAFSIMHDDVNFIYINSVPHLEFNKPGCVDWNDVKSCIIPNKHNVLLLHHSLILEDSSNHSDIEHSATIALNIIDADIKFVFHSHTHAGRQYLMGRMVPLIGCGSLTKDISDMENMNNQFNVIQIENGEIKHIEQRIYIGDREQYIAIPYYPEMSEKYSDPFKIEKIQYPEVEFYIRRMVLPHSVAIGDQWEQYFAEDSRGTLIDVCNKTNRVWDVNLFVDNPLSCLF